MRVDDGNRPQIEKAGLRLSDAQKGEVHKIWKEVEEVSRSLGLELGPAFYEGMEEVSEVIEYDERPPVSFSQKFINRFLAAFCFAPFYSLIVDWAGNVGPCACAGSVENPTNNLRTGDIKEIWYGKFFQSARKSMLRGEPLRLEKLLPMGKGLSEGKSVNPCKTCGINIERQEINSELPPLLKQTLVRKTKNLV
jgi:hypothetical protein